MEFFSLKETSIFKIDCFYIHKNIKNMDNVYVLYQYFQTMKDTDITIHEAFESKIEAIIQMDYLITISQKSHEGSLVQSFDHDDETSKQVTDKDSFWDVYIVKKVKYSEDLV